MQKVDVKFYAFDDSFETINETFSAASLHLEDLARVDLASGYWPRGYDFRVG